MDLKKYMWQQDEIPTELGWTILVLTPKGNTNTQGIGLIDTLRKLVKDIIDNFLKLCIIFHEVLHGFCAGRGMGMAILELKLAQEMSGINKESLFLVFLDLHKAYDNFDRGYLLTTLEGYGDGPHMCGILAKFWEQQEIVTQKNGYHVPQLKSTRGTTQGGLIPPILFNTVVKNVVRNWLSMTVEEELVVHNGLGLAVGQFMGKFYADNGLVGS